MARTTQRQHNGRMFDPAMGWTFSHEMRTFTAKDMKTGQGEVTTSATTMKHARRRFQERLGHSVFIVLAAEPTVLHKAA